MLETVKEIITNLEVDGWEFSYELKNDNGCVQLSIEDSPDIFIGEYRDLIAVSNGSFEDYVKKENFVAFLHGFIYSCCLLANQ